MQTCRVREIIIECRLHSLVPNFTSSPFMANHPAIKQRFLHGTGVQLQQRTSIRHDSFTTNLPLLPTLKATIITSHLQYQAGLDTIKLAIKSLLDAKLDIIHGCRANPALRRVTKGFEGLCQLL
jgi:hypothetical protein